jgi:protein-tyrosine phosphatase
VIDLHNHLLPGIDDGADDMATALAMARMAVESGTTHMVCTPHLHAGRYDNTLASIAQAVQGFRAALAEAGIPLQVAAAAEVRFDMEIMLWHAARQLPFLGEWQGRRVLLLEFPHSDIPFGAERLTQWLLDRQVQPLIAHPERNKGVMRAPSRLKAFIDQGCLLQVTAGSLVGRFGERAQELAEALLRDNVVSLLASDAHNPAHRPPLLGEGRESAARLVGDKRSEELVRGVPWEIAQAHFSGEGRHVPS